MPKTKNWKGAPKFTIEPERARRARKMGVEIPPTEVEKWVEYKESTQVERRVKGD